MSGGRKVWWVFCAEYVEEGAVAVVRARSAGRAIAQVRHYSGFRYDSNGVPLTMSDEEPVELMAVRISKLRLGALRK